MLNKKNKYIVLLAAFVVSSVFGLESVQAEEKSRIFEMRTYYANEGKLEELKARFRDHTVDLFKKHGMINIGYWVPAENKDNKLIYILAYSSKEAREKSWKGFLNDPDWKEAFKASIKNGRLVKKIENDFLKGTDFSAIK
ncbi:MAG: NIPSNAP family protein [Verrucomicrobiales bacterium]|nr:NIPSNAP family protein [Verrucomicrobiales bacterium]|tara:strand:+ start:3991 stop:4410 length:420 start_codon:yes stop_codon:yes gene_type:complete